HTCLRHPTPYASSLYAGKIYSEFSRDLPRDRRRFYSRFLAFVLCGLSSLGIWFLFLGFFLFLFFGFRFFRLLFFFLRLLFFFLLLFGLRLFFFLRRFFAFSADERNLIADVHLAAFFDVNFGERSVLGRFPFHCRLVSFDLRDHITGRNFVALFLFPCDESPLG